MNYAEQIKQIGSILVSGEVLTEAALSKCLGMMSQGETESMLDCLTLLRSWAMHERTMAETPVGGSLEPVGSAIRIGQFRVSNFGAGKCWIANSDGEGMETSEAKLAEHIGEFFKGEF